jgi:hypothetical protein
MMPSAVITHLAVGQHLRDGAVIEADEPDLSFGPRLILSSLFSLLALLCSLPSSPFFRGASLSLACYLVRSQGQRGREAEGQKRPQHL